jgi:hydrogenase small subunit
MNISRRQFLQYCTASAAALGLSQLDLLKLQRALAGPSGCDCKGAPHVIWFQGQSCGGCTLSILNRMPIAADVGEDKGENCNNRCTWAGLPAMAGAVQDVVDLVVGDAVGTLGGTNPRAGWATFPKGYICLDYQTEVMAGAGGGASGNIADYIEAVVNSTTTPFFVGLSGAIPLLDHHKLVGLGGGLASAAGNWNAYVPGIISDNFRRKRSIAEILPWLALSPGFSGLVAFGTCASFGGIPAARGNWTAATGAYNYLINYLTAKLGVDVGELTTDSISVAPGVKFKDGIINVPGCAPHPDWMIYPIAHILLGLGLPTLDKRPMTNRVWYRGRQVYTRTIEKNTVADIYTDAKGYDVFCEACSKRTHDGTLQCYDLGGGPGNGDGDTQKEWCTGPQGCNGFMASPDCPTRRWNNFDDHTRNQWCVGQNWGMGDCGATITHTGANYVCQGCAEVDFPDGRSPFFHADKGYY